ncbi:MAG TPA: serine hydrolase domain-containing protein [Thermoanaerobaculia bacterium]|jgi:CubicO group peptidase (beta-lactamase class C family)|nr:serine hydrolase domain-containing protein [Thermoanaerobaculia bacterium]
MLLASLLLAVASGTGAGFARYLEPVTKSHDFNGVVLIARGDRVVWQKAYGNADWDLQVPLTMQSKFRVASITKTFTAAAVSILAERGKLAYTDPLSKFIPDFPKGDKITIRQLLGHQSGVPNPDSQTCSSASLTDIVAELAKKPLWFEPGTSNGYSNGGYALLARVVEVASGKSWKDFLRDEIFQPLALGETTVDVQGAVVPRRARGFVPGPGAAGIEHARCEGAWAAFGSGAVISSANDLYRWARDVRNDKPFKRTALEYPYGWGKRNYFGKNAIEQSGIVNGFSSYVAAYLDEDLYIVVLSNVQTGELTDVGKGLAAVALGVEPPKLTPSPATVVSTAKERAEWTGKFRDPNIATTSIFESDGTLYLRWENSPDAVYLAPTAPSQAFDREDSINLTLSDDRKAITMRWSDGKPHEFQRLP